MNTNLLLKARPIGGILTLGFRALNVDSRPATHDHRPTTLDPSDFQFFRKSDVNMSNSNSWEEDDRRNIEHYAERVEQHGDSPRSLDWISRESQEVRFSVLSEIASLEDTRILDVGCGTGDFYGWLRDRGVEVEFVGVDITPEMVEFARSRYPGADFYVRNLLEESIGELRPFDYVFSSGIFTYRSHKPFQFLKAMVQRMFDIAEQGLAFNALSTRGEQSQHREFYADPVETLSFCHELTPWLTLRHDYFTRDFTLHLYHEKTT